MERLYIRHRNDLPHSAAGDLSVTKCGIWLAGAKEITEKQALVYFKDARCPTCFPGWTTRKGHTHG